MSKKRKKKGSKKRRAGKVRELPFRGDRALPGAPDRKLSEIIKEMALRLLENPDAIPSEPAAIAALMLAGAAWNSALGDDVMRDKHRELVDQIDWEDVVPWAEFRSADTDKHVAELADYKRQHYPEDRRRIVATEMTPEGEVRVHWTEPEKVVAAAFGSTTPKAQAAKTEAKTPSTRAKGSTIKRGRPIASKLVKRMNRYVKGKVVDLKAFQTGKENAAELQKTVATRQELADYHPAHAIYIYAQNQVSVMSEQLTALQEMDRFGRVISKAEDDYMPGGPPMSPLTTSFFTCWAFFDVCVGLAKETIGTTTMAVGTAFGMHKEFVRVIGLMQESRMGVYAHEGAQGDTVVLRELVTDTVCRALVPSGYRGRKGELWYVRVLPPALPGIEEHVVFTTPYVLMEPASEWHAYFRRTLPDAPAEDRIARYEHLMKFGPARDFWTEFVFEAYLNHRSNVIFLKGLPDVAESRPHSSVNS
ncbi:MAG: hypothetical protein GY946_25070 [bacterium]|nr:hypothetical protein [bacterium]